MQSGAEPSSQPLQQQPVTAVVSASAPLQQNTKLVIKLTRDPSAVAAGAGAAPAAGGGGAVTSATAVRTMPQLKFKVTKPTPPAAPDPQLEKQRKLGMLLQQLLEQLESLDKSQVFFSVPTDDEAPGYSSVITKPMAWAVMRKKVAELAYSDVDAFTADFLQIVDNCMKYNDAETYYFGEALRLLKDGMRVLKPYSDDLDAQVETRMAEAQAKKQAAKEKALKRRKTARVVVEEPREVYVRPSRATQSSQAASFANAVPEAVAVAEEVEPEPEEAPAVPRLNMPDFGGVPIPEIPYGPPKLNGLPPPLLRHFVDVNAGAPPANMIRESASVRRMRELLYGNEDERPLKRHEVSRPRIVVAADASDSVKRNYGVDLDEEILFDRPAVDEKTRSNADYDEERYVQEVEARERRRLESWNRKRQLDLEKQQQDLTSEQADLLRESGFAIIQLALMRGTSSLQALRRDARYVSLLHQAVRLVASAVNPAAGFLEFENLQPRPHVAMDASTIAARKKKT